VDVVGSVTGSRIHHNYFGVYSHGGYGIVYQDNEVDHNVQYGIDPHDDSDHLLIADNFVHDNGNHGIICSQRCDNLAIRNNRTVANAGNGIMLHRSVVDSLIEGNEATDNEDAGIALFESHRNTVRNNKLLRNLRGIRLSVGSADNTVSGNDIGANTGYGIYTYQGTDVPTTGDGRVKRNRFSGNTISVL
jgi:parallel beta-helix repeat protein